MNASADYDVVNIAWEPPETMDGPLHGYRIFWDADVDTDGKMMMMIYWKERCTVLFLYYDI